MSSQQRPFIRSESTYLQKLKSQLHMMGWRIVEGKGWRKFYPAPHEVPKEKADRLKIIAVFRDERWYIDLEWAVRLLKEEGLVAPETEVGSDDEFS